MARPSIMRSPMKVLCHEDELRQIDRQSLCGGSRFALPSDGGDRGRYIVDYGADGEPVGFDIQHASTKTDFIAKLILEELPAAE